MNKQNLIIEHPAPDYEAKITHAEIHIGKNSAIIYHGQKSLGNDWIIPVRSEGFYRGENPEMEWLWVTPLDMDELYDLLGVRSAAVWDDDHTDEYQPDILNARLAALETSEVKAS